MKKWIFLTWLIVTLCLTLQLPHAQASEISDRGTCGENLTWVLDDAGKLTISGTGEMFYYTVTFSADDTPWAAYKQDITKIVIEEGVSGIGNSAFENCAALTTVTLADSVTTIGERAFKNCVKLVQLNLGNGLVALKKEAFSLCKSLIEVTLPESLTTMDELVFSYCESLVCITIPDGVPRLGRRAFYECASLFYVSMPDTLGGIDGETFSWCESLQHVLYRGNQFDVHTPHGPAIPNQYFRNATKHYQCTGDEIRTVRTEATCAVPGTIGFTCSVCDATHLSALPQREHTWKNATCTTPRTCYVCHTTAGEALGSEHIWDEGILVQEPMGNQVGVIQYTCTICSETKVEIMEPQPKAPSESQKPLSGDTMFIIIIISLVAVIGGTAALISLKRWKA